MKVKLERIVILITLMCTTHYFFALMFWRKYLAYWDVNHLPILSWEDLIFPTAEISQLIFISCLSGLVIYLFGRINSEESKVTKKFQNFLDIALGFLLLLLVGWFIFAFIFFHSNIWWPLLLFVNLVPPLLCLKFKINGTVVVLAYFVLVILFGMFFINWLVKELHKPSPSSASITICIDNDTIGDNKNENIIFLGYKNIVVADSTGNDITIYATERASFIKSVKDKKQLSRKDAEPKENR